MSVADFFISILNFFLVNLILPILPVNLPFLPIYKLTEFFNSDLKNDIIYSFSGIGKIFPIKFLILMLIIVLSGEILLGIIKVGKFLINLIRGSGA